MQLKFAFAAAENARRNRAAERRTPRDRSRGRDHKVAKTDVKREKADPAERKMMNKVVEGLEMAFNKVAANNGAPGPDGRTIEDVEEHLPAIIRKLSNSLLAGTYKPGGIRRVWIDKSGGGKRGLGIPNVVDRMVQEAFRMVLEPLFEPKFHPSSHGFRPGRGCQTAIAEARSNMEQGYKFVVDIDLKSFFDRVHHQRLLCKVAEVVGEHKDILCVLHRFLQAPVVQPGGVREKTTEGVPQGAPLSPLLSNIVLNELDWKLASRGLRFVRYADDCNIYVRSERAGLRVMQSTRRFIETRLRLEINEDKSTVAQPCTRHFLGYRLKLMPDNTVEVLLSKRSEDRLAKQIVALTPRSSGRSLDAILQKLKTYLKGWMGHFNVCTQGIERTMAYADAHIRRRLRAIILAHWKRQRTIARRLIRLGVKRRTAWKCVRDGHRSIWALSHQRAVERALRNSYFEERGLFSLLKAFWKRWNSISAPVTQLSLFPAGT